MNFSLQEKEFLSSMEESRFSTMGKKFPHVKPVSYVFLDNSIIIATDYKTKTFKNLKQNPMAAVSIDVYNPGAHKAILVQGEIKIIDEGPEFKRI
ncbi:MAG: pyridoxamine 5'-phosphate oxidase family protein, partial [Candidatus Nitrosotenuis sp.]